MTALLETHDLTARYGDFQALFGVDIAWRRRDRRHYRRQRRGQDDTDAFDFRAF
jgi:hypothetical protein